MSTFFTKELLTNNASGEKGGFSKSIAPGTGCHTPTDVEVEVYYWHKQKPMDYKNRKKRKRYAYVEVSS